MDVPDHVVPRHSIEKVVDARTDELENVELDDDLEVIDAAQDDLDDDMCKNSVVDVVEKMLYEW